MGEGIGRGARGLMAEAIAIVAHTRVNSAINTNSEHKENGGTEGTVGAFYSHCWLLVSLDPKQ